MKLTFISGLLMCCFLVAIASDACTEVLRQQKENKIDERSGRPISLMDKPEKMAVQGLLLNEYSNFHLPKDTTQVHQKKPLSKDEKKALRRQINQVEHMYSGKN